jgi:hypothetical protein
MRNDINFSHILDGLFKTFNGILFVRRPSRNTFPRPKALIFQSPLVFTAFDKFYPSTNSFLSSIELLTDYQGLDNIIHDHINTTIKHTDD